MNVKAILRHLANIYRFFIVSKLTLRKLNKLSKSCGEDIACIVDLVFNFEYKHMFLPKIDIKPLQIYSEILELANIVFKLKPRYVLEIGTANGGTLFLWSRVSSDDANIISIDLPGGSFGGGYSWWRISLYKGFAKARQRIYLLRRDSHDYETLYAVKKILGRNKLDFLFIDGDHSYEGVKKDFIMYSPLVREGGVIAFHDIVKHPPETGCEVEKFWNEIKHSYRHREIINDLNQKWAGIGVIYV